MARDRRLRTSRPIRVRGSVIASHSGSCARWRGRQRTTVTGCKTPPTLLRSVGRTSLALEYAGDHGVDPPVYGRTSIRRRTVVRVEAVYRLEKLASHPRD